MQQVENTLKQRRELVVKIDAQKVLNGAEAKLEQNTLTVGWASTDISEVRSEGELKHILLELTLCNDKHEDLILNVAKLQYQLNQTGSELQEARAELESHEVEISPYDYFKEILAEWADSVSGHVYIRGEYEVRVGSDFITIFSNEGNVTMEIISRIGSWQERLSDVLKVYR